MIAGSQIITGHILCFKQKYLHLQTVSEDRLELEIGRQWTQKFRHIKAQQPETIKLLEPPRTERGERTLFYNLTLLFFAEIATQAALDIDLLDTLFFQSDHSIQYLFKDSRKGLTRIKPKNINICEVFLKRNCRKKEVAFPTKDKLIKNHKMTTLMSQERSQKSLFNGNLGYVALLKYKDGSSLRLKEADVRSIFTNPLYANERFRHNNCAQYIQSLPAEGAEELKINYNWAKFRDQPLLNIAREMQLGKQEFGDKEAVKKFIFELSSHTFVYFTIFEICWYIMIHYNRRIESALFHFVKEGEGWALAGVEACHLANLAQPEFARLDLWEGTRKIHFGEFIQGRNKPIFRQRQEEKSLLYKQIEGYFDRTSSKIKSEMIDFVQGKIDNVKRVKDKILSRAIFQILHPNVNKNLYDLLDSPEHLAKVIEPPRRPVFRGSSGRVQTAKPLPKRSMKRNKDKNDFVYKGIEVVRHNLQSFPQ